jgi:hypothetical protein
VNTNLFRSEMKKIAASLFQSRMGGVAWFEEASSHALLILFFGLICYFRPHQIDTQFFSSGFYGLIDCSRLLRVF